MNEPQMKVGTVEMVSVEWIMKNTTDSVDCIQYTGLPGGVDYEHMIKRKAGDWDFATLVNTIMKRGFRVPIVLQQRGNLLTHGNGHHRMCAAILLGLDEIPVFWSDSTMGYMCIEHSSSENLPVATEDDYNLRWWLIEQLGIG